MIFSYNWLQSFFSVKGGQGQKLPKPEKLAELLTMHSFEAKVLKDIRYPSGNRDIILDIDILPNRAHDCFSHFGIAKEISAITGIKLKTLPKQKISFINQKTKDLLDVEVKEPDLCKRYIAAVILDLEVKPSPDWIAESLSAIGQKPINSIVDACNYVMFELGQPLHAFDFDKIESVISKSQFPISKKISAQGGSASGGQNSKFQTKKIIVRKAAKGEKITTLDNRGVDLDESILVIADAEEPLAIAGIKGGKKPEVDKSTKNIILEAANFNALNIRQTSKKLGLKTGASVGFENEISPVLAGKAMERVIELILMTAGGSAVRDPIDIYSQKVKTSKTILELEDISKLIGINISSQEILRIFESLGFAVKKEKERFLVAALSERLDISQKEDLIEEIARIYGYGKIPALAPIGLIVPPRRSDVHFFAEIARNALIDAGFSEVYNYSFSLEGEIEVENPPSEDRKYLRARLLDGLREFVSRNLKYFDEVRIFEIGKVFHSPDIEKNILAAAIGFSSKGGKLRSQREQFYELKGALEMLFSRLGIHDFYLKESENGAEIKINNETVGAIKRFGFEVDFSKLIYYANEELEYRPISKYPPATRDIAVLVPAETKVGDVEDVIQNTGGEFLVDADLFDIYEGGELEGGKKNFAFHLTFQSRDKTLSDKEVNELMEKIIKALESAEDWEVRK
jgi:phenylalanyl-tRNA synthetase beta chain